MAFHTRAEPVRESRDRALKAGVVERLQAAALTADEVVMVLSAGIHGLEPGLARVDDHALDQAVFNQ